MPIKVGEMQCERRFKEMGRKTEGRERERERERDNLVPLATEKQLDVQTN